MGIILGDRKATARATNHRPESYFDGPIIAYDFVAMEGGLQGKGNAGGATKEEGQSRGGGAT